MGGMISYDIKIDENIKMGYSNDKLLIYYKNTTGKKLIISRAGFRVLDKTSAQNIYMGIAGSVQTEEIKYNTIIHIHDNNALKAVETEGGIIYFNKDVEEINNKIMEEKKIGIFGNYEIQVMGMGVKDKNLRGFTDEKLEKAYNDFYNKVPLPENTTDGQYKQMTGMIKFLYGYYINLKPNEYIIFEMKIPINFEDINIIPFIMSFEKSNNEQEEMGIKLTYIVNNNGIEVNNNVKNNNVDNKIKNANDVAELTDYLKINKNNTWDVPKSKWEIISPIADTVSDSTNNISEPEPEPDIEPDTEPEKKPEKEPIKIKTVAPTPVIPKDTYGNSSNKMDNSSFIKKLANQFNTSEQVVFIMFVIIVVIILIFIIAVPTGLYFLIKKTNTPAQMPMTGQMYT